MFNHMLSYKGLKLTTAASSTTGAQDGCRTLNTTRFYCSLSSQKLALIFIKFNPTLSKRIKCINNEAHPRANSLFSGAGQIRYWCFVKAAHCFLFFFFFLSGRQACVLCTCKSQILRWLEQDLITRHHFWSLVGGRTHNIRPREPDIKIKSFKSDHGPDCD